MTALGLEELFKGLPDDELRALKAGAQTRRFRSGATLFREGEATDGVYLLQQGQVEIVRGADARRRQLTLLQPGDLFGEMSILDNKPRSASAVALGDVVAIHIGTAAFQAFLTKHPLATAQLRTAVVTRLNENIRRSLGR